MRSGCRNPYRVSSGEPPPIQSFASSHLSWLFPSPVHTRCGHSGTLTCDRIA
ncbi:hypothetical protein D915_011060, partial [Fasciola hepatica]